MKRYIILIRLNRRRTKLFKKWQLLDETVTASSKELASHAAAKRFPNYFVKVREIISIPELDELETLGHIVNVTDIDEARRIYLEELENSGFNRYT